MTNFMAIYGLQESMEENEIMFSSLPWGENLNRYILILKGKMRDT